MSGEKCKARVYREGLFRAQQCHNAAGHGRGGNYCRTHAAKHPAEDVETFIVWQVSKYSLQATPVEAIGETPKFYTLRGGGRQAKQAEWVSYFENEGDALLHIQDRVTAQLEHKRTALARIELEAQEVAERVREYRAREEGSGSLDDI